MAPGSAMLRDLANTVDVALLDDAMALAGSDATGLSATANLALIGDELIQFATAEQIAPKLFRLGGLLRGRRGSEWAMAEHAIGERFVLIDAETLFPWSLPTSAIGRAVQVSASGAGDASPVVDSIVFQARAMRPPAPVGLSAVSSSNGSIDVAWTRRSRLGWDWLDDTDVPLGEESERYQLIATRAGGNAFSLASSVSSATIDASAMAAIGGSGPLDITIVQVGTTTASLPPAFLSSLTGA